MIPVTKPFLPPQQIYQSYLDGIWKRQWLKNTGPLANDLELDIKGSFKSKTSSFCNKWNGRTSAGH